MTTPAPIPQPLASAERRWLRRYGWLFPVAGIPLGLLLKGSVWSGVLLNASFLPARWVDWLSPLGLLIGLGIALIPLIWRLVLAAEERLGAGMRRRPVAPMLAVLCFVLIEMVFRTHWGQGLFWQAVIARAGTQAQAREVGLYRLHDATERHALHSGGLVVAGSSQIVFGVDGAGLSRLTGLPVYRRAVAGLFPVELVCSQGFTDFHPDNRLVLILSGFDVGARPDLMPEAIRPQTTWAGLRHVLSAARTPFKLRHWRNLTDLAFAATCDVWRSRDYVRFVLDHPAAPYAKTSDAADKQILAQQKKGYERLGANDEMVELCLASLDLFFADMADRCREIVVFEGRLNPARPGTEAAADLDQRTRAFFERQQELGRLRFIAREEQQLDLPEEYWADNTHVTPAGRRLLTEMMARFLEPPR